MNQNESNKPLISVIVPVYNVEEYVYECLSSIKNQTYRNLQVIVVNDGSTDGSRDEISKICDPRFIAVDQNNQGLSAARNTGLSLSKGEYVSFVDSDDLLPPDFIEQLYFCCIRQACPIAVCQFVDFVSDVNANPIRSGANPPSRIDATDFWSKFPSRPLYCASVCNKLWLKNFIDGHIFEFGRVGEDLFFSSHAIDNCVLATCDQTFYYYRRRETSISHNHSAHDWVDIVDGTLRVYDLLAKNKSSIANRVFSDAIDFYIHYFNHYRHGNDKESIQIERAIRQLLWDHYLVRRSANIRNATKVFLIRFAPAFFRRIYRLSS